VRITLLQVKPVTLWAPLDPMGGHIDVFLATGQRTALEVRPGDMVSFNGRVVHAGHGHAGLTNDRAACSYRYHIYGEVAKGLDQKAHPVRNTEFVEKSLWHY
jgi:hypothetical protein